MTRNLTTVVLAVVAAALLGLSAVLWLRLAAQSDTSATRRTSQVAAPVTRLSEAQANRLRADNYAAVAQLVDVLALGSSFARGEALYALSGRMDVEGVQALIIEAQTLPRVNDKRDALVVLFQRYAELDPGPALAFLRSNNLHNDMGLVATIFGSWAESDLAGALDAVHGIANVTMMQVAADAVIETWRNLDPEVARKLLNDMPQRYNPSGAIARQVADAAHYDPVVALGDALNLPQAQARAETVAEIGRLWARKNPQAAMEYGQTLADSHARQLFLQGVLGEWTLADPDSAMAAIIAMKPGRLRHPLRITALDRLITRDPARALEWAGRFEHNRPGRTVYTMHVLRKWAIADPTAAAARLAGLPRDARVNLVEVIASNYARSDPAQALAWVDRLGSEAELSQALPAAVRAVAERDPDMAMNFLLNRKASPARSNAISVLIAHMADNGNASQASTYLDYLTDDAARAQAIGAVANNWSIDDPHAALAWSQTLRREDRNVATRSAMAVWAQLDLAAAVSYAQQNAQSLDNGAISGVLNEYLMADPAAAVDWLERFADDPHHQHRVMMAVGHWAQSDVAAARRYAQNYADPQMRNSLLSAVVQQWAELDAREAARWVAQLPQGDELAGVAQQVASRLARSDYQYAANWASELSAGSARDGALGAVIARASSRQPQQIEWVNQIGGDGARFAAARSLAVRGFLTSSDISRLQLSPEHQALLLQSVPSRDGG